MELNIEESVMTAPKRYERYALYSFIFAISFTVLGPVVHYTGLGITAILLLYGRVRYKDKFFLTPDNKADIRIYAVTVGALIWSMFANALSATSFYMFGKSATVSLEILITLLFVQRLFNTDAARGKFLRIFIVTNVIIASMWVARFFCGFYMPNKAMQNGNALAVYALLLMPVFYCYAFYSMHNLFVKILLCVSSAAVILISFSAGAWIAAAGQGVALLFCLMMHRKVKLKKVFVVFSLSCVFIAAVFFSNNNLLISNFRREVAQLSSFTNTSVFTNHRSSAWLSALYFIKEKPIIGYGRATYEDNYREMTTFFRTNGIVDSNNEEVYSHPHNMFLNIVYDAGIPSIIMFACAVFLLLKKLFVLLKAVGLKPKEYMWVSLGIATIIGQLLWGLSNDVFDARRDAAIIFWAIYSILIIYPSSDRTKTLRDN
ncbi:MAG: O-antigen ligase family protein [Synergistaceae bacterium]|nr:O-antigen ligase family protein [Synergistaceae bacterium]